VLKLKLIIQLQTSKKTKQKKILLLSIGEKEKLSMQFLILTNAKS